jgi:CRISPR-associated endonuclease/helicase Cas3
LGAEFAVDAKGSLVSAATNESAEREGFELLARYAGLLHDVGKYQQEFQSYLRASAKKEPHPKVPHAPFGAASALASVGLPNAFVIAGHHQGLPDTAALRRYRLQWKSEKDRIWESATKNCAELKTIQPPVLPAELAKDPLRSDVLIRMLFSCLVDADWCDTNAWKEGRYPYDYRPLPLSPSSRFATLEEHVRAKPTEGQVNAIRRQVYANCIRAGREDPGFYTLTVPTGGGKTLASLAFALTHCAVHENARGPRRIIYVIPYLNILEQTANVLYEALHLAADGRVLFEHHSLAYVGRPRNEESSVPSESVAETEPESPIAARMEENWEAPIILTTSVQFFESLFSNRPSAARKLHHVARSVVIFDECQTFPEGLYRPTLAMLQELVKSWGVTFVFCTATQPAVRQQGSAGHGIPEATIQEIMLDPKPQDLFKTMHRVRNQDTVPRLRVTWPCAKDKRITWKELAEQMHDQRQALAIVNIKRHARQLFEQLGGRAGSDCSEGVFYLSTLMCAEHRRAVLKEIKRRLLPTVPLAKRPPCFVASTQLVEAGVDFDFPAAFRAFGPLDAIGQAAGRCNRENMLADDSGTLIPGRFVVFRPSLDKPGNEYPTKEYERGAEITQELLEEAILRGQPGPDIFDPRTYERYFAILVARLDTDEKNIESFRTRLDFPAVATRYKLIDDMTEQVIVPFSCDGNKENSPARALVEEVRSVGYLTMEIRRKLQPYLVNLWPQEFQCARFKKPQLVEEVAEGWWEWIGRYDSRCGLMFEIDVLPVV